MALRRFPTAFAPNTLKILEIANVIGQTVLQPIFLLIGVEAKMVNSKERNKKAEGKTFPYSSSSKVSECKT